MRSIRSLRLLRLVVPLLTSAGAFTCNILLAPVLQFHAPFLWFIAAVMTSAWLCGARGGVIATAVSVCALAALYYLNADAALPLFGHVIRLSLFAAEGGLLSWAIGAVQEQRVRLVERASQHVATLNILEEREVRLREMHHRAKNNFQLIASLLRLQARETRDPRVIGALGESSQRVEVISLVHELLAHSDGQKMVNAQDYLTQLTHQITRMYAAAPTQIDVNVSAIDVPLPIDQVVSCGLIVHELLANSVKHAFPEGGSGAVGVTLLAPEPGALTLSIWDNGVGMELHQSEPRRQTLGMRIVHDLVRQLRGTLTIAGCAGTSITIQFPANLALPFGPPTPGAERM